MFWILVPSCVFDHDFVFWIFFFLRASVVIWTVQGAIYIFTLLTLILPPPPFRTHIMEATTNSTPWLHYLQTTTITILSILEPFCTIIYILLTITALSSLTSPFLQSLASHGKTRNSRVPDVTKEERASHKFGLVWKYNEWIISKRRFVDFYVVGLVFHLSVLLLVFLFFGDIGCCSWWWWSCEGSGWR